MSAKAARLSFLVVCLILATLLAAHAIRPIVSGSLFAVALVTLGVLSRGFRRV